MSFYFTKSLPHLSVEQAVEKVTRALKEEGFGVLTNIDVQATFRQKLDVEFKEYRILGACNPNFAHQALQVDDKLGVFLPCNVVVTKNIDNEVQVTAINPLASMVSVNDITIEALAKEIHDKLKSIIDGL